MMRHSLTFVFVVWVLGFGMLSLATRNVVARNVARWKLPLIFKYYLILTPIVLLEEALTIEVPYFWGILPILAAFYLFFFLLFLFQRFTRVSFFVTSLIFGGLGWINEFLFVGRIYQISGLALFIMSILCWLIYSVMAILPSAYLQWELEHSKSL